MDPGDATIFVIPDWKRMEETSEYVSIEIAVEFGYNTHMKNNNPKTIKRYLACEASQHRTDAQ